VEDSPGHGNLGLSAGGILTLLVVTNAGMIACIQSTCPFGHASTWYTMLVYHDFLMEAIRSFGTILSPVTFSAHDHSTNKLLHTL